MKDSLAIIPSSTYLASGSRLAACAAAWCGLHCALTPFLAVAAPALALSKGACSACADEEHADRS